MKFIPHSHGLRSFIITLALAASIPASAKPITESFTLQPGWNAVYFQVEPTDSDPAVVFSSPAISQVWTESVSDSPVQYISSLTESNWNEKTGLRYIPAAQPGAFVSNLFRVLGNTGYLVEVEGGSSVSLIVTGEPSLRPVSWRAESYTLSGLSLDSAQAISVGDYFLPSLAHTGQKVRTLNSLGNWIETTASSVAAVGNAYWVYTTSGSTYEGPLRIEAPSSEGILFVGESSQATVTLENLTGAPITVMIENSDSLPLLYKDYDPLTGAIWPALSTHTITINAFQTRTVEVGIRKTLLGGATEGNLKITGGGCQKYLPILIGDELEAVLLASGLKGEGTSQRGARQKSGVEAAGESLSPYAGLWIGQVLVDEVAFVNDGNPAQRSNPVPAAASFPMRLLVHFDGSGAATLLGQVTVMKTNEGDDEKFVLISDSSLLNSYDGATIVDGEPFGYRISALAFGGTDASGTAMIGSLTSGLSATLTIAKADPVNPYRHRYHPDHDGLNPFYQPYDPEPSSPILQELWDVSRTITLTLPTITLDQTQPPGASESDLRGTYEEVVTGMHKRSITSRGEFSLQRLVKIPDLNPAPVE